MVYECPTGLENWPRRVKAPAVARNREEATVKIRRNPPLRILPDNIYLNYMAFNKYIHAINKI